MVTPDNPLLYCYTRNQRAKETRMARFKAIREKVKSQYPGDGVRVAEQVLARATNHTTDLAKFQDYVKTRAEHVLRAADDGAHPIQPPAPSTAPASWRQPVEAVWSEKAPLHRKLRLSAYLNQQQANTRLAKNLRNKFGSDAVLVMGNWSAPMSYYFEPIRDKGMRQKLQQHGFKVYLLDEHKTSKVCPTCCVGRLQAFKAIPNPRPFKRAAMPPVRCHGLLKCTNETCLAARATDTVNASPRSRLWNRDLAAVLNFRHILVGLRQ
ncbi:hypothetical protein H4R35_002101 [Dimargaris xerosporica]|nr:hypothetical protein H4R35_002101 [Dimargaris xerosporica]